MIFFFFQAEDGIRDDLVTGVQTCALPISSLGRTRDHSGARLTTTSECVRSCRSRDCAHFGELVSRPENPGVGGSIPPLPTTSFNHPRTPPDGRPTSFVSELCQLRDPSTAV